MRIVGFSWLHSFNGIFFFLRMIGPCEMRGANNTAGFLWIEVSFCMIPEWKAVMHLLNRFYPPPLRWLVFWNCRRLQLILYNSLNKDITALAETVHEQKRTTVSKSRKKEEKKKKAVTSLVKSLKKKKKAVKCYYNAIVECMSTWCVLPV